MAEKVVAGKYLFYQNLATTLHSDVILCGDPKLQRKLVVKIPRATVDESNEQEVKKLLKEAQLAAKISNSNVVTVYDAGIHDNKVYIAMEYVDGSNLRKLMTKSDNWLQLDKAVNILMQICNGLSAIHAELIIHADIKPENILIAKDGKIKITDFNTSTLIKATLQSSGQLVGTFPYMAPEQFSSEFGKLDIRTDIWALGVVFYEMLTGEYPITVSEDEFMNPFEWRDAIVTEQPYVEKAPQKARNVILRALSKKKSDRYGSVTELRNDLEKILEERKPLIQARELREEGDEYRGKGELREAIEKYQKSLELDKNAGTYFELAYTYELNFNDLKALESYQKAFEFDRGYEHAERAIRRLKIRATELEDKVITCSICGEKFVWAAGEQKFYMEKGFPPPKRCPNCRKKKKQKHREKEAKKKKQPPKEGKAPEKQKEGTVKAYKEDRGFGFISTEGLPDVFVHISNVVDGESLSEGERVLFNVVEKEEGKFEAKNVQTVTSKEKVSKPDTIPSDYEKAKKKTEGKVKFFDKKKGFGFILREGLPNTFVHISNVLDRKPLRANERVLFNIVEKEDGKTQAVNVQKATSKETVSKPDTTPSDSEKAKKKTGGKVKFFDKKKGFGFILRKGLPDIFVHASDLMDAKSLKEGERVLFELEERGGKPQAKNVERFQNP